MSSGLLFYCILVILTADILISFYAFCYGYMVFDHAVRDMYVTSHKNDSFSFFFNNSRHSHITVTILFWKFGCSSIYVSREMQHLSIK